MNPQEPAINVSKTGEWRDATAYKIECDCHSREHAVDLWIETEYEDDCNQITVSFHAETTVPFWNKGFNRFKLIWEILTTGYYKAEHHFILNEQSATTLVDIIKKDLTKFNKS